MLTDAAPRSILVIDDDTSIRGMVRSVLLHEGYVVHEAAGGRDAIARIVEQRYDVLLLDLMMSDGNGEDVLDALRTLRPGEKCVIIMTAASPAKLAGTDSPNVAARLRKPFDLDDLFDAVRHCAEPVAV
jgi:DNA-binding NtrC family response regulator